MTEIEPGLTAEGAGAAGLVRRGVMRWLIDLGYQPLAEFSLKTGRRIDVYGLDSRGDTIAIEIKSGLPDFRADRKWTDYLGFCDRFYFAVDAEFPLEHLPEDTGILIADGFGADVYCESPRTSLASARRRSLILRFACAGAARLYRAETQPMAMRTDRMSFG